MKKKRKIHVQVFQILFVTEKKAQDAKLRKDKSTLQFSVNQGVTANTMQIANWSKG